MKFIIPQAIFLYSLQYALISAHTDNFNHNWECVKHCDKIHDCDKSDPDSIGYKESSRACWIAHGWCTYKCEMNIKL